MNGPFDTGGPQSPPSKSDFVSVGIEFMREINAISGQVITPNPRRKYVQ